MKYTKCLCCRRKATKKFRGRYFCDDCLKSVRRDRKCNAILTDRLVLSLGQGCGIYRHYFVKLK